MNLNLGSSVPTGKYKRGGWINMDLVRHGRIHTIGDGTKMPFKDDSFESIHCVHVLEHVTRDKYPILLKEIRRVLKPGGRAYVEVPDFEHIIELLSEAFKQRNKRDVHIWTTSIYGKNERPGMAHHWGFSENLLLEKMHDAGFVDVKRLVSVEDMISEHYKQEPVILMSSSK